MIYLDPALFRGTSVEPAIPSDLALVYVEVSFNPALSQVIVLALHSSKFPLTLTQLCLKIILSVIFNFISWLEFYFELYLPHFHLAQPVYYYLSYLFLTQCPLR